MMAMNKLILLAALAVSCFAVAHANFEEKDEVKDAIKGSYSSGLDFFTKLTNNQKVVESEEEQKKFPAKQGPFSQYTAKLPAPLGGGKPALADQYREHNYVPPTPSVVPREFPFLHNGLTPEAAAKIYVPHGPLQFSTDRLRTAGRK